jgi:diphthamide biosynthesis protein 4
MESLNAYEVLGVEPTCTQEDIKTAYKKRILECHPDKLSGLSNSNSDNEEFLRVQRAWKLLSSTEERQKYDNAVLGTAVISRDTHSITEFTRVKGADGGDLFILSCRCGDRYEISEEDLADGYNTVQCNGCSLYLSITD